MSRAKVTALLGLVDSDDEGSNASAVASTTAPISSGTMAPARRSRATAASAREVLKTVAKDPSGASEKVPTVVSVSARKVLVEKPLNIQPQSAQRRGRKRAAPDDALDSDKIPGNDSTIELDGQQKGGRGRPRAAKLQKISAAKDELSIIQPEPVAQPAKRGRKAKAKMETRPMEAEFPETQRVETEIPETQPVAIEDLSVEEDEEVEELPPYNRSALPSVQRPKPSYGLFNARRKPLAASDSELHDPAMRRRIGDLTRRYDTLEARYRDLREIGVKEAALNYDRLKKQAEERVDTANQLIATLKAQLSSYVESAKECERLKQQLENSHSKVENLQSKITEMTGSLAGAKAEVKTLSTKLTAARAAETVSTKVPGSAMKGTNGNNRLLANAEAAAQTAQTAQMKENLYGDLTGLIVCGVKSEKDEEVYDCIQTGRNGTLHFKLAVKVGGDKYEDAQVMYLPQLDPKRDEELIEMLPDYLVEEITFPRLHAAKFYSRVVKALTENLE